MPIRNCEMIIHFAQQTKRYLVVQTEQPVEKARSIATRSDPEENVWFPDVLGRASKYKPLRSIS